MENVQSEQWRQKNDANRRCSNNVFCIDFECIIQKIPMFPFTWMLSSIIQQITLFRLMFHFYTPWKRRKSKGFLTFSRGIEMEHSLKWANCCRILESIVTKWTKKHFLASIDLWKLIFCSRWHIDTLTKTKEFCTILPVNKLR